MEGSPSAEREVEWSPKRGEEADVVHNYSTLGQACVPRKVVVCVREIGSQTLNLIPVLLVTVQACSYHEFSVYQCRQKVFPRVRDQEGDRVPCLRPLCLPLIVLSTSGVKLPITIVITSASLSRIKFLETFLRIFEMF